MSANYAPFVSNCQSNSQILEWYDLVNIIQYHITYKLGAWSRWSSCLYCPMWYSNQMTTGKTQPTLSYKIYRMPASTTPTLVFLFCIRWCPLITIFFVFVFDMIFRVRTFSTAKMGLSLFHSQKKLLAVEVFWSRHSRNFFLAVEVFKGRHNLYRNSSLIIIDSIIRPNRTNLPSPRSQWRKY